MPEVNPEFIVAAPVVPAVPATPVATAAPVATPVATAAPVADPATPIPTAAPVAPIEFTTPPIVPTPTPSADTTIVYESTGDAGLDVALQYIGERGFAPDHPAMQAATKGDFTLMEAELTKLGDKAKGAKGIIALAKDSYARRADGAKAAAQAAAQTVHEAVGGADKWAPIQAWVQETADPAQKAELNAAFKAGGIVAAATAQHLAALYAKHGKTTPKAVMQPNAGGTPPVQAGALSPSDYGRESAALHAKLGTKMESSPEYAALQARRRAYRA